MAEIPGIQRAVVVGTGLIGGSIGRALRAQGWHVSAVDADADAEQRAVEIGAVDAIGFDPEASITFVAAPVHSIGAEARRALERTTGAVTDVGGVKASIVADVDDARFVGGHPMAGSEQLGVDGSSADMFRGAIWVLTPVDNTDPDHFATVSAVVRSMGADVVALTPERHDALVAVVSHVPHLTAAALMTIADERADDHVALLRLAAGGFRDMTRIAAGSPAIWPDVCRENQAAIVEVIDRLTAELGRLRTLVATGDRESLLGVLEHAQAARRNLPSRVVQPAELAEIRVPVPDRGGVIAEVATLAAELDVNIADMEIAHSTEGDRGVLILLIDHGAAEAFRSTLVERGYLPTVTYLT